MPPSPFGQRRVLRQAMTASSMIVLSGFLAGLSASSWASPMDVYNRPDELVVEVALPGVKPDEVITITGDPPDDADAAESGPSRDPRTSRMTIVFQEIRRRSFNRSVSLPSGSSRTRRRRASRTAS